MSTDWQPSATTEMLAQRARLYGQIRAFMDERGIMEVETPILDGAGNPDPNIHSLMTALHLPDEPRERPVYLHTSPEFAMKRLLAAGAGPIYQITKVFRDRERGALHQPEFSMLEWYRPGFDHRQLMDEVEALLEGLQAGGCGRLSYGEVFENALGFDPHGASISDLAQAAGERGLNATSDDRPLLLDFLFNHSVAPNLGRERPQFVYDFPACQAALARLSDTVSVHAERFELFISGMEIANGFNELCDNLEQEHRFKSDNQLRARRQMREVKIDRRLLAALAHGMPACAGVAVGLDRLLMAIHGSKDIRDVVAFPFGIELKAGE